MSPSCSIPELDEHGFAPEVLQADVPVFVLVAERHCEDCHSFRQFSASLGPGRARCYCLDAERFPELARRYAVTYLPTLLLFRNGRVVRRLVGRPVPGELEAILHVEALSGTAR